MRHFAQGVPIARGKHCKSISSTSEEGRRECSSITKKEERTLGELDVKVQQYVQSYRKLEHLLMPAL